MIKTEVCVLQEHNRGSPKTYWGIWDVVLGVLAFKLPRRQEVSKNGRDKSILGKENNAQKLRSRRGRGWDSMGSGIWGSRKGLVTKDFQLCHRVQNTYLEDNWKPWKNFKQQVLWSGLSLGETPATEFGNGEMGLGDLECSVEKASLRAGWIRLHGGLALVSERGSNFVWLTGWWVPSLWDRAEEEWTFGWRC